VGGSAAPLGVAVDPGGGAVPSRDPRARAFLIPSDPSPSPWSPLLARPRRWRRETRPIWIRS